MAEEQKTSDLDELMKLQSAAPFDDDYQVKSVNRDNAQNLDWFESKNRELGIQMPEVVVGGEADPAKPAEGAAPAEAQPTTFAGQVWDKTKAVGSDLAGIPTNAANIVVGGPMKAVEGVAGLTGTVSDWIEKNIVSFGGLQILDSDGNFDPQVLGPENWEKFKETVGDKNAERWHDMFNVAGVMDTPKDSYSAQMLQAMAQFLTGFGAVGRAAPALKLSSAPATSWAQAGTEAAKLMTRSSITDFAAFDGHEGNLANLVESFPTLQNPVTEFLATNEETPELVGRLQNTVANIPFNVPFGVFLSGLRSIREARKVKVETGAETYQEAAEKLAKGGVDVGEGAAPPPIGNKIHEILGDPNDDIVKFVEPYVQQTADAEAVGARFAPEPKTDQQTFGDYLKGLEEAVADPNAPRKQSADTLQDETALGIFNKRFESLSEIEKGEIATALRHDRDLMAGDIYGAKFDELGDEAKTIVDDHILRDADKPDTIVGGIPDYMIPYVSEIERMFPSDVKLGVAEKIRRGENGDTLVAGGYNHKRRTLDINLEFGPGEFVKTARHEAAHALNQASLFHPHEWQMLVDFARAQPFFSDRHVASYTDRLTKELSAKGIQDKAIVRQVIDTILDEERVAHVFENMEKHGANYPKPVSAIIQRVINGEVASRSPQGATVPRQVLELSDEVRGGGLRDASPAERSATIAETPPPKPPGEPPIGTGSDPDQGPFSRKVNINWARIDTNDDVKSLIGQMADMYAPEIQAKQRGVRTNAQTIKAAGDQEAWKVLIGERKGNLPTAEEQLALRQLWASSGEKLAETAKLATSGDSESMFAFRRMLTVHNMIQQEVIGVRTETARALQQWRIPAGGNKEMLDQLNFAIQSHGGENVTRALAERIAILADRPEWQGALDQMVRKSGFAKTMDSVREIWINAILSGPKTHIVNMMSNSAVVAQSIMERAVAGRLGHVLDPVEGVRIGEATAMWWGMRQSMRDALAYSWQAFKTGNTGYGRSQLEGPRVRAISAESWGTQNAVLGKGLDMMGSVVNVPGRMLQASDEFFKTINYRAELWAQAFRQASSEVDAGVIKANELKGRIADIVSDPPENIRLKAADMAAYNTFTNEPGNISKALMRVRTSLDESSRVPLGTMILPFINTPGNLMKFTFERTPLAPLMAKVRADIAAGGTRRDLALARVGMGSILTTVAFDLAMDGTVTSSGPSGDKGSAERQALTRGGWQPYSIKVRTGGTDANPTYRWYAYNRLDPVGGQLAMAAELAELLRNSDGKADPSWEEAAAAMVLGASQTYMNKSYFSGVSNLVAALQNPDRYGESYFTKLASSFVPTGVAEVAKFNDPVQRATWDMLSKIKARTPGLSKDLPPRLDFWGKPMEYDSGLGATYDAVSPIYSKTNTKAEPIDREFFALHYFPTHPGTISMSGRSISLRNNPDIKNRMIELTSATKASQLVDDNYDDLAEAKKKASAGRLMGYGDDTMLETLNKMVDGSHPTLSVEYKAADDDDKVKLIQDVIKTYRDAAKVQVIRENPDLKERRDALPSREELSEEAPF